MTARMSASDTSGGRASQEPMKAEVMAELEAHPFRPPWWLKNSHAQTVWGRYGDRAALPDMRLERWETPDDDFVRVHIAEGGENNPLAILLHGLEGSVESTYLVRLVNRLRDLGWTVVVLEHRSCGGEMNRARRMYHSGASEDLDFVVGHQDALVEVNESTFGLQAGIFTRDLYKMQQAWDELDVGGVIIGDVPSWRVDNMPYGGVKDSGLGREGVRFAMEDMTEIRNLVIRTPQD